MQPNLVETQKFLLVHLVQFFHHVKHDALVIFVPSPSLDLIGRLPHEPIRFIALPLSGLHHGHHDVFQQNVRLAPARAQYQARDKVAGVVLIKFYNVKI